MTPSQHLLVLVSLLIGLALRELVTGARATLDSAAWRENRIEFACQLLTITILFIVIVQFWWFLFVLSKSSLWAESFLVYLVTLIRPLLLFYAASNAVAPSSELDVWNRSWLAIAVFEIINGLEFLLLSPVSNWGVTAFHAVFFALALILARKLRPRIRLMALFAAMTLVAIFIRVFSRQLA